MERGFLSQKESGRERGVKEKEKNTVVVVKDVVSSSVIDEPVVVEKLSSLVDTSILNDDHVAMEVQNPSVDLTNAVKTSGGSYPPLPTQGTTPAGNTPGKSSYANVIGELRKRVAYPVVANYVRNTWGKFGLNTDVNLLKEDVGNVSVWLKLHGVPVMVFSEDGLNAITTKLGTPIMLDSYTTDMYLQYWGREGFYACNVRVEYEWKPPRCACCKIFGHTQMECSKNPDLCAGAGETKKKKPSKAPKGISVGLKMAFKPNQEYRLVPKKNTANSSGKKKKGVDYTNKVSDSNPFEVLYSVDNDEEIVIDGQAILVDEAGNPLKKVEYPDDHDSEDEVASVDNDMARSLASKRTGFGTQSLLEQWRDSYGNGDYDEDPYEDDMYEGQDLFEEIQTICNKLDIRV
nr:hypothetical protein [Tanacetum cinerariifolium]